MAKPLANMSDAELLAVATQTVTAAAANPAAYGKTPAEVTAIDATATTFDGNITDSVAKAADSKASYATKDATRHQLLDQLRNLRDGAKLAGASEAEMAATGLPQGGPKQPSNATVPVGSVNTSARLHHTISWYDAETPGNRRRPRGVLGAEIYLKLDGAPPIDETECVFLTLDTDTPYTKVYAGTEAGKMAHYMLRWRFRDDTTGPWAETVSATITG